jgi:hypothetical protein
VLRRPGLLVRLRCRCRNVRLDRLLAAGAAPESDVALALRAQQLAAARARRGLLDQLETLALMAEGRLVDGSRWAIVSRRRLRRVRPELRQLTRALSDSPAPDVRGLARVRLLLVEPDSPLYGPAEAPADDLRQAIALAIAALARRQVA